MRTLYAGWSENVIAEEDYEITGDYNGSWYRSNVTIRPAGDYTAIWNGEGWAESLTIREGKAQEINFKLKKTVDGEEIETTFLHDPLILSVDTTMPGGAVTIGDNKWHGFLNTITFGLFFKDTVQVSVEGTDELSGLEKVEYLRTDSAKTLDELKAESDWTEGTGFTVEPDEKFVTYARVTDRAGHISYLSSDGVIVDATAPVITAEYVYEGEWTSDAAAVIQVNVSDNLAGVDTEMITYTVNGEQYTTQDESFTISGLPDGDYDVVITARDKSGNDAAVRTVHVKKDATEPTLSVSGNAADWTNQDVTLHLASDSMNASGKTIYVSKDGGEETALPADDMSYTVTENGTYVFRLVTGAGLEVSETVTVDKIDKTDPVIEAEYAEDGQWTNDAEASIQVKVTDDLSDIRSIEYTVKGEKKTASQKVFTIEDLPDGDYDVVIKAIDNAGNAAGQVAVRVKKETVKAGLTVTGLPDHKVDKEIVLTLTPEGVYASGMTIYVSRDGGREETLPQGVLTYTVTKNGVYTFRLVTGAGQEYKTQVTVDQIKKKSAVSTGDTTPILPALMLLLFSGILGGGIYIRLRRRRDRSRVISKSADR